MRGEEAAVTLARASGALRDAAGMVDDIERAIGRAITLAGEAAADQVYELQKLDHLQQKILGVADFLEALGGSMPGDWRVDAKGASRRVLLADLGARLGGARAPAEAGVESYELF
jgi:hypothetical protein